MSKKAWIQGGFYALLLTISSTFFLSWNTVAQAQTPTSEPSPTATEAPAAEPTTPPALVGPGIKLIFSIPGIASQGGNVKPLHPERNVAIMLYKQDVNTGDSSVEPLYTVQGKAVFDDDPSSPNYGKFVISRLDMGDKIEAGYYQLVFKIDQALQKLITEKETDIGGVPQYFSPGDLTEIPAQTVVIGDIIPSPHGDNIIDIRDYNAFMNCYGNRASAADCPAKQGADFDDNGVIDGIDYNLMLLNFQSLLNLGWAPPALTPAAGPTKAISPTKLPAPPAKKEAAQASSGSPLAGIFMLLLFIALIVCLILYFVNPKFKGAVQGFLKKLKAKKGEPQVIPPDQAAQPAAPGTETPAATDEKSYYVKKDSDDETKTGVWLNLTDDNGQTLAHYAGTDVVDGFAKVKGEMKTENGKTFLEISQITPEA